jgi:hypothetical protein
MWAFSSTRISHPDLNVLAQERTPVIIIAISSDEPTVYISKNIISEHFCGPLFLAIGG